MIANIRANGCAFCPRANPLHWHLCSACLTWDRVARGRPVLLIDDGLGLWQSILPQVPNSHQRGEAAKSRVNQANV